MEWNKAKETINDITKKADKINKTLKIFKIDIEKNDCGISYKDKDFEYYEEKLTQFFEEIEIIKKFMIENNVIKR